jgi:hypothetical protein
MIAFNAAELAALEAGTQRMGYFWRLDVVPVARLWLGFGDITPGINVYDPAGALYKGLGQITELPPFKQLTSGAAERVTFSLSGVTGRVLQVASGGDAEQVRGKRCAVGFSVMAPDWSLLGPVHWCANYTADYLSINQDVVDALESPIVRSVTLSCGTLLTGRKRPGFAYFSNQDQQARFSGDRFCERTPIYANGFNKAWPKFSS